MNTKRSRSGALTRYLIVLPALIVGLSLALTAPASAASPRLHAPWVFRDNFTKTPDPNWIFQNRYGMIGLGSLIIGGPYMPNAVGRDGWALTHVGDRSWRNYQFSDTYNTQNVGTLPPWPNGLPGCCPNAHQALFDFRVAAASNNIKQSMYEVQVWDPGQGDPTGGLCGGGTLASGLVGLAKYTNGTIQGLKTTCSSNSHVGTNAIRITVNGGDIAVSVNGRQVLSYHDAHPISYGGVGLQTIWENTGWFGPVVVKGL